MGPPWPMWKWSRVSTRQTSTRGRWWASAENKQLDFFRSKQTELWLWKIGWNTCDTKYVLFGSCCLIKTKLERVHFPGLLEFDRSAQRHYGDPKHVELQLANYNVRSIFQTDCKNDCQTVRTYARMKERMQHEKKITRFHQLTDPRFIRWGSMTSRELVLPAATSWCPSAMPSQLVCTKWLLEQLKFKARGYEWIAQPWLRMNSSSTLIHWYVELNHQPFQLKHLSCSGSVNAWSLPCTMVHTPL